MIESKSMSAQNRGRGKDIPLTLHPVQEVGEGTSRHVMVPDGAFSDLSPISNVSTEMIYICVTRCLT